MQKQIYLLLIFLFLTLFIPLQAALADGAAGRALEIVYPEIPNIPTPKYVSTGLPDYVKYVFSLAVVVVGFVILGALLYSGFQYLTSFGNPTKLSDAKDGIIAAFSGAAILLLSYLIFNTINPQLLILEPPKSGLLYGYIVPGVYICNYKVPEIKKILDNYTKEGFLKEEDYQARNDAIEELKEKMGKAGQKNVCFRVQSSGPFTNFVIKEASDNWTIFVIPFEKTEYDFGLNKTKISWEYQHGVVLHGNDKYGGRCALFPSPYPSGSLYNQIDNFHPTLDFTARAITLFKIPDVPPPPESKGAILYQEVAYNQMGGTSTLVSASFKPSGDTDSLLVPQAQLQDVGLYHNVRSIEIDPDNKYLAILQGAENKCAVKYTDDADLTDASDPIGRCGTCGILDFFTGWTGLTECYPCIELMQVIKGQRI